MKPDGSVIEKAPKQVFPPQQGVTKGYCNPTLGQSLTAVQVVLREI